METPAVVVECKLKHKCQQKSAHLCNCWDADCQGWMHVGCCKLLLDKHEVQTVDRPGQDELTSIDEPTVFCKKGCYNKWIAARKRLAKASAAVAKEVASKKRKVPWEEDGSLDVLMEWLTTEGNYAEHCGATHNKGKSKTQHHKELALSLQEKLPGCERNEKDVENKIVSLERQFRLASDWANNTGQGVDKPGDFEAAVLKRCPLFKELEPVMGDRPNAKPLATSEDDCFNLSDEEEVAQTANTMSLINEPADTSDEDNTPPKKPASTAASSTTTTTTSSSQRRITVPRDGKKRTRNKSDDLISNYLNMEDDDEPNGFKQLRVREVLAREKEAEARMIEAEASSKKAATEASLLSIQQRATLLRERKKLADEGVPQEDIDRLLPLQF